MRIYSLNVNGLRSFSKDLEKDFNLFLLSQKADVFCFQEIKGSRGNLDFFFTLKDFITFASFHQKKGRHGVATLIKKDFYCEGYEEILPGRIIKTKHKSFDIYNCYMPYDKEDLGDDYDIEIIKEINNNNNKLSTINKLSTTSTNTNNKLSTNTNNTNNNTSTTSNNNTVTINTSTTSTNNNYNLFIEKIYKPYNLLNKITKTTKTIVCGDLNATYSIFDSYSYLLEYRRFFTISQWKEKTYENREIEVLNRKIRESDVYEKILLLKDEKSEYIKKIKGKVYELPLYFLDVEKLNKFFFRKYQRRWFLNFIKKFKDTFRLFDKSLDKYTVFDTKLNLREKNIGSRIDFILCTKDLKCINSFIDYEARGSDHLPVVSDFSIEIEKEEKKNLLKRKNNLLDFIKKRK